MALFCFSDVLRKVGIDPAQVKLLRLSSANEGFAVCRQHNMIDVYAAHQSTQFGQDYGWWAVFLAEPGTGARFYALYQAKGFVPDTPDAMPDGFPFPEWFTGERAFYELEHSELLKEYEQRLVINWGGATALWHQSGLNEKPITALTAPEPYPFPGYERLVLNFACLQQLAEGDPVYESWQSALSSTKAVYLITHTGSGRQFVGATYGDQTLMGRWRNYVVTRHGGIAKLRELLRSQPEAYRDFQFSILQALPLNVPDKAMLAAQSLYQQKLCSREFGFND